MANLINGKMIAAEVNRETALQVERLRREKGLRPGLAVVLVGQDPASRVYVGMKEKKTVELGMYSEKHELPAETSQQELLSLVDRLNRDDKINGILVQSPPPPQINEREVVSRLDPGKDVDCFHPYNVGKMLIGDRDGFFPCTPGGVMVMLRRSGIDPSGKHAVVIGRSNIVGKPMAALLMQKEQGANATVTVCHSRTPDIGAICREADIIVAAIGKPRFLTAAMVKPGAVVIDVGINRVEDSSTRTGYRLVGDVDFAGVSAKASLITPVPGGVGPMTIAMLLRNTLQACLQQNRIRPLKLDGRD